MKNIFIFMLIVVLAGVPLFCEKIGTLNVSSETVSLKKNTKSDFKQTSGKSDLFKGTTIKTELNGSAFVKYPGIAEINIKKNTIARFEKSSITMKIGRVSYKFIKKGHKFTVKLPVAIIGVLGTEFDIEVKKDKSCSVKMKSGIISLKTRKGKSKVSKNEIAYISMDGDVKIKKIASLPLILPFRLQKKEPVKEDVIEDNIKDEVEQPVEEVKTSGAKSKFVGFEMIGDLDRDGKITSFDAGILSKYLQKNVEDLTALQKRLSDVDGNGKIDTNDQFKLQIYLDYKIDLNSDGKLDQNDVQILKEVVKYQENKKPCDINLDGKIDVCDINELKMIVEQLKGCSIGERK
ncbi:FecR domain-containing protein [bacterium]|nr:FecR domain-containing protein [bacterium]